MNAFLWLLRFVVWAIKRLLIRLYGSLMPVPTTASEKMLVAQNKLFWSQYDSTLQTTPPARYVLIEKNYHPVILVCNASFARIVSIARSVRPLFILESPGDKAIKRVLRSYHPGCAFVYLSNWRYGIAWLFTRFQAKKVYRTLKTPADVLRLRIDGVKYGDLVYDGVLTGGYATINKLDERTLNSIHSIFWHRYVIRDIMQRYDIATSIFSHIVSNTGGTFSRYLLRNGIEVLHRTGSYQLQIKKYHRVEDVGDFCLKPEPQYMALLKNRGDDTVLKLAEKYLDERFNQKIRDIAVDLAFDEEKRTFNSKEEFCAQYGLDAAKKMVFVMLHAFNDKPHSHFSKPMLYQDYFDWFIKTLEVAKTVTSVNWIFKEHPAAHWYETKDCKLDEIFAAVDYPHIRFLNYQADINARSLCHVADAIITCMGTAGQEFSCFGIPCVLAGESPYSGYGFTTDPGDIAEYEAQLRHIDELPRLTEEQIRTAKIGVAFQYVMMQGARYLLCPFYEDYNQIRMMNFDTMWHDTANLMKNGNKDEMRRQIGVITGFLNNPSYTQYIDLEKYNFVQEAVYGK